MKRVVAFAIVVVLSSCGISDAEKQKEQKELEQQVNEVIGGWEKAQVTETDSLNADTLIEEVQ
ncbi:MAG: hypothetical protein MRY83_02655 [Flavobacteriales bacterium]|nr:hypothetical protein [Flavobacteriales bacterium]